MLVSWLETVLLLVATGCRQDMQDQPKFFPQRGTDFYADGRSVRPQVLNTVARGQLHTDTYFDTGLVNGKEGDGLPFPVTLAVLERGQERYNVYCTPCHSRVGNGAGMIVQRGYRPAGNFHTARLETAPLGHFFNVISNGYGAMPDYSAQITPADRWAIAAYIRALQLSQHAKPSDVANGAHVEALTQIETDEGFPAELHRRLGAARNSGLWNPEQSGQRHSGGAAWALRESEPVATTARVNPTQTPAKPSPNAASATKQ